MMSFLEVRTALRKILEADGESFRVAKVWSWTLALEYEKSSLFVKSAVEKSIIEDLNEINGVV